MEKIISTHTPHARCDIWICLIVILSFYFYSHTSCEVRHEGKIFVEKYIEFLLTHLMRGATHILNLLGRKQENFYSHTSCEVRLKLKSLLELKTNFYSHTSCEVRLVMRQYKELYIHISTHTPHARCDALFKHYVLITIFLLTHLMRGATNSYKIWISTTPISTHTPHARCD